MKTQTLKPHLNQLEFDTPVLARFVYNPGKHFSFPLIRCVCGEPLDTHDYCFKCQKHMSEI